MDRDTETGEFHQLMDSSKSRNLVSRSIYCGNISMSLWPAPSTHNGSTALGHRWWIIWPCEKSMTSSSVPWITKTTEVIFSTLSMLQNIRSNAYRIFAHILGCVLNAWKYGTLQADGKYISIKILNIRNNIPFNRNLFKLTEQSYIAYNYKASGGLRIKRLSENR